jgi:hypothetical protein
MEELAPAQRLSVRRRAITGKELSSLSQDPFKPTNHVQFYESGDLPQCTIVDNRLAVDPMAQ